jgi:hypothetical protein
MATLHRQSEHSTGRATNGHTHKLVSSTTHKIGRAEDCPTGCGAAQEHCYCRPDLQPIAYSWIGDCIKRNCAPAGTITLDLQTASGIYTGYCSAAGYPDMVVPTTSIKTITSSKALVAPSPTTSDASPSSPTPTTASGSQILRSHTITTMPPATAPQISTQPAVTPTKVLVCQSSASSISTTRLGIVLVMIYASNRPWFKSLLIKLIGFDLQTLYVIT